MVTAPRIRVLLVDDNPLFLQTMRSLLETYPDVEVIGTANDGCEPEYWSVSTKSPSQETFSLLHSINFNPTVSYLILINSYKGSLLGPNGSEVLDALRDRIFSGYA